MIENRPNIWGWVYSAPRCIYFVFVLVLTPFLIASISIKKTQELYLGGLHIPVSKIIINASTFVPIKSGYVLRTPYRLYFYSHELNLIKTIEVGESNPFGVFDLTEGDDTLLYTLELGCVAQYNSEGVLLRKWRYPIHRIDAQNLTKYDHRLIIAGQKYRFESEKRLPELLIFDLEENDPPNEYTDFYSDTLIKNLDKDNDIHLSADVVSYKDGFVAVASATSMIFGFSYDGRLLWVIDENPPGYKGLLDVEGFDLEKSCESEEYDIKWEASWDYFSGWSGIRVIEDSLLVVPRRNSKPYYIDLYNLKRKHFITRLQSDIPIIGVSRDGNFYFADSISESFLKIAVCRIVDGQDQESDLIEDDPVCKTCGRPLSKYEYAETPKEKIGVVDSVNAGRGRIAYVHAWHDFEPYMLRQFCSPDKKNIIVFISPDGVGGDGVLIDSLSKCLEDKRDWSLTTVVCYQNPEELGLYLSSMPGNQIIINRNVAIPDSTLALSDLELPPIALAFDEGGKKFIAGYSLAPNYDQQKKLNGKGISFSEFLQRCGITE